MGERTHRQLHLPPQGEGKVGFAAAEGRPGGGDAAYVEAPAPPPGLLARAGLPPSGGGGGRNIAGNGAALEVEANRAVGRVCLGVAATPSGTRRTTTREEGSLRVRLPNACAGAPEAVLVNTSGGIAGGDRFAVDLTLDAGARLTVTTTAAEKVYRSLGPDACFEVSASLKDSAELTWLPQETILFDRARLARTITIALAPSAKLLLAETIVFGRAAMGETVREGSVIDRWRVRRDGRLIFAENFRIDGPVTDRLNEAAIAGGCTAIATVLMVPGDDVAVAAARTACGQFRGEVGISAWNGVTLARLAARDGAALRHDLVALLSALGRCALPRIWLN